METTITTYRTTADAGAIRIFSKGLAVMFSGGSGDGVYDVEVRSDSGGGGHEQGWRFGDSFETAGGASLSSNDCDDEAIHEFAPGRWLVYHKRDEHLVSIRRFD